MDLSEYRRSPLETLRTDDLLHSMPAGGRVALDVGARDGHFARLLAERFDEVIALDLVEPQIVHPKIRCVRGDAARLELADRSVDFVFCAEVLEHIAPPSLARACGELERVSRGQLLIGVPYRQDIRVGRTTCRSCGGVNPPWGHVNTFDERRMAALFPACRVERMSFVGSNAERTNRLSAMLMDLAGNPYGTYTQEEPCIHCGAALLPPAARSVAQKLATRLAFMARRATSSFARPRANWIHLLLSRRPG